MQEKGLAAAQVEGVGVGVPGPVLDSRIVPIICANLGGWGKHNVAEELSTMLGGIRVLVGNDANVAALGEIWMGAAKGCRSAVMVTLGTGVGGGVIVNGKVIDGTPGAGGEIQLTDAMAEYARTRGGMTAVEFTGKHYDMGNKLKVVEAQVELALQHPEIGEAFREYLKEFCKTL